MQLIHLVVYGYGLPVSLLLIQPILLCFSEVLPLSPNILVCPAPGSLRSLWRGVFRGDSRPVASILDTLSPLLGVFADDFVSGWCQGHRVSRMLQRRLDVIPSPTLTAVTV